MPSKYTQYGFAPFQQIQQCAFHSGMSGARNSKCEGILGLENVLDSMLNIVHNVEEFFVHMAQKWLHKTLLDLKWGK